MSKAKNFDFMVFGTFGQEKISVISDTTATAVQLAKNFEIDGVKPLRVELVDTRTTNFKFLRTE